MSRYLLLLSLVLSIHSLWAQERPQETVPAPSPQRQLEIRDSIRARSRVKFSDREVVDKIRYEPDRALLMPAMERSAIFRIGLPMWLMRAGISASRDEFDSEEEYKAARYMMRRIRKLRIAAYANNPAYSASKLQRQYARFNKRKRTEPVLTVRAPGGGVSIDVKVRRGKVRRVNLLAYGDDGAAVIRVKCRIGEKDVRKLLSMMQEETVDKGIIIDIEP
jgi:hypothetical protein